MSVPDPLSLPLWLNIVIFLASAVLIAWAGSRLAVFGDRIADRTGLGEAITGTLFLGLITALPGLAASITAALDGRPALAISNAVGGIAVQTTFLAVADIVYTKANLEHAAASLSNMIQTVILIMLLTLVLMAMSGPETTVLHFNPVTPVLFAAAVFGFILVFRSSSEPMWRPRQTVDTVQDLPDKIAEKENLLKLLSGFGFNSVIIILAGAVVAHTTGAIADSTGLSETVAGGLLSGTVTSLPELVTTVAAVNRGALTLAVSDIVGGNFFDILFVSAADLVFLEGSIYHASGVTEREDFLIGFTILLNVILLLGLLYRQRKGPANIGFESLLMLLVYVGGYLTMILLM